MVEFAGKYPLIYHPSITINKLNPQKACTKKLCEVAIRVNRVNSCNMLRDSAALATKKISHRLYRVLKSLNLINQILKQLLRTRRRTPFFRMRIFTLGRIHRVPSNPSFFFTDRSVRSIPSNKTKEKKWRDVIMSSPQLSA